MAWKFPNLTIESKYSYPGHHPPRRWSCIYESYVVTLQSHVSQEIWIWSPQRQSISASWSSSTCFVCWIWFFWVIISNMVTQLCLLCCLRHHDRMLLSILSVRLPTVSWPTSSCSQLAWNSYRHAKTFAWVSSSTTNWWTSWWRLGLVNKYQWTGSLADCI